MICTDPRCLSRHTEDDTCRTAPPAMTAEGLRAAIEDTRWRSSEPLLAHPDRCLEGEEHAWGERVVVGTVIRERCATCRAERSTPVPRCPSCGQPALRTGDRWICRNLRCSQLVV